jgi:type 1 fimbria pilin
VGLHTPVNPSTDFVADVSLMHAHSETQAPPGASDGSGYGLGVGLRHLANEQLEVNGGLLFTDFDDSDSEATLHFGLVYHASPSVGLCTNVSASDDLDTLTLGLRFTP